jgi:hypothetical protein
MFLRNVGWLVSERYMVPISVRIQTTLTEVFPWFSSVSPSEWEDGVLK